MEQGAPRRRRVLISAYACGPGDESEAGAGWGFAVGAAQHSDVWVVTRERFREPIEAARAADPELAAHLSVAYLDLSPAVLRWKRRGVDVYWYYALWQRRLAELARRLHADLHFDVAHHVTFAADWLPCGLRRLDVPLVWGPVGGATYLPWRLARWVGARGAVGEGLRSAATRMARRAWGDPVARRAAVIVGQNGDEARRFAPARVVVEPNAVIVAPAPAAPGTGSGLRTAVLVSRLVPWKGVRLALEALARPEAAGWQLVVYGSGPDAARLHRRCTELGLDGRVRFAGHRPRTEVLAALSDADALLFPSLHDSAGWAAAEASAAGLPVVCLDVGGPALLAGPNARVVPAGSDVVAGLARALERCLDVPTAPYLRWGPERLADCTAAWYAEASGSTG